MSGIQLHPDTIHATQAQDKFLAVDNANATLTVNQQIVEVASDTSEATITLPNVSEAKGRIYSITAPNGGTNTVTVQDNDESVDWADQSLDAANDQLVVQSDGRRYNILTPVD